MDLFLKFESAEQAKPFLYDVVTEYKDEHGAAVLPNVDGELPAGTSVTEIIRPKFLNLDIIGDIYKPTGETQEVSGPGGSTVIVPIMEKLDGYHVNVRLTDEDTSEIEAFVVTPTNPVRVWA